METAIWILRFAPAITMFTFGIHQIMNPNPWFEYVPKWLQKIIPPAPFMKVHGAGNILLALFLVSGLYPLVAAWVVFIWWLSIVPSAMMDSWRTGMRDLSVTLALLALIVLQS
jgi:uncharacterized membrane protein YphA (DoxX/SURF4 family)